MNKTLIKKYTILSSIILILIIMLVSIMLLKNKGYSLPKLKVIDSDIQEIIINRNSNENISIKYDKNKEKWIINNKYNADTIIVENIINTLKSVQPVEIVSRGDKDSIQKYKLNDDEILSVIALDNSNKEVRNIKFGMKSTFGNSVYAKIDNNKNIYLFETSKDVFDKSEEDIINKTISKVYNDDILKITITTYSNSKIYTLEKSKNEENKWIKTWDNNLVDANELYSSTFNLSNLKADSIIKNMESNTSTKILKIDIQKIDNNIVSYTVEKISNGIYIVKLENDDNIYSITENTFNNLEDSIKNIIII